MLPASLLCPLPTELSAVFCAAADKFMEQRQQLSLSLYYRFSIDSTQSVKSGSSFPASSCMADVRSEVEKHVSLPNQAVSLRELPSTNLSAVSFCSAAWVCHGHYQSKSWQPCRTFHAQEQAVHRPHLTAGLFTHEHACAHQLPVVPTVLFSVLSVGQDVLLLWLLGADGREISKCLCILILIKQGQVYIVRIEPSFTHLADIHALMRVQSSHIQSTCCSRRGRALTGMCSNVYLHF